MRDKSEATILKNKRKWTDMTKARQIDSWNRSSDNPIRLRTLPVNFFSSGLARLVKSSTGLVGRTDSMLTSSWGTSLSSSSWLASLIWDSIVWKYFSRPDQVSDSILDLIQHGWTKTRSPMTTRRDRQLSSRIFFNKISFVIRKSNIFIYLTRKCLKGLKHSSNTKF